VAFLMSLLFVDMLFTEEDTTIINNLFDLKG